MNCYFLCICLSLITFNQTVEAGKVIRDSIEVDCRQRIYILYFPESVVDEAPLVFALHGYGGSANEMMDFSKMNFVAEKHGFVVCYPQGVFGLDEKNSWNAGYSNDDVDDVKFLTKLARHIQSRYQCSEKNTFCTGMSNGADMSYVLACQAPEVFAAIAPVAGCMMNTTLANCHPGQTVPVFAIHGTADEITLWDGDPDYSDKYGGYKSVGETIDFWVLNNKAEIHNIDTLNKHEQIDGNYIILKLYTGHGKRSDVWLYKIVDGKHDWPGSWGNKDIVAAEEIWKFFERYLN